MRNSAQIKLNKMREKDEQKDEIVFSIFWSQSLKNCLRKLLKNCWCSRNDDNDIKEIRYRDE